MAPSRNRSEDGMTLNIEDVPRDLVEAVKAKAAAEFPPMHLKHKLIELMARYVAEKELHAEDETADSVRAV